MERKINTLQSDIIYLMTKRRHNYDTSNFTEVKFIAVDCFCTVFRFTKECVRYS